MAKTHKNPIATEHPLKGKTLAIIDASAEDIIQLQKVCLHYQANLIVSKSVSTVPYAVKAADHVLCYQDCPNPRLCEAAYENCALAGKEVHLLEESSMQHFNHQLAQLSVEVVRS